MRPLLGVSCVHALDRATCSQPELVVGMVWASQPSYCVFSRDVVDNLIILQLSVCLEVWPAL